LLFPSTGSKAKKTMSKQVRFSPSLSLSPLSPHDDAARIMLDLHNSHSLSISGTKRKFAPSTDLHSTVKLVSPNDDEQHTTRFVRDPALPAPPFLDEMKSDRMERDAKRMAETINPLDLLSTVSLQLARPSYKQTVPSSRTPAPTAYRTSSHVNTHQDLQRGCRTYPNGSTYLGHFLNITRHGFGICHYPKGHIYTGLWSNGRRHGLGKMQYADGSAYEGCWIDDRIEGRGVMHYSCGMADVALWKGGSVYGVRWDAERKCMWRLVGGVKGERVETGKALEIGAEVGVEGVPERTL
jgi:hypothetical protein